MTRFDVVIVGAGHGGAQTAIALRQAKFAGSILVIGDEPELPYERPPLSKEYLKGEKSFERLLIRPPAFWQERDVQFRLGERVVAVDPTAHQVTTDAGMTIGYGKLVWATGGYPRRLSCSGATLRGVHTVRGRADVDRMRAEIDGVERIVVVGGGYIGLEAAAVLAHAGKQVVLLEALDRVLARVAGEPLSRFFEVVHRAHGVDIRLGTCVECITGADRVSGVELAGGDVLPAQMVIVGIGIVPAVEPLIAAGATGPDDAPGGVEIDDRCRTTLPDIFALGDCALHHNRFADGRAIRLESVQNANDQAMVVARTIAGIEASYSSVPWFWSTQYDFKLQTVGLSVGFDATVLRGSVDDASFSLIYLKEGRVIALDCVNAVRDYAQGRKLVEAAAIVASADLANTRIPLNDFS